MLAMSSLQASFSESHDTYQLFRQANFLQLHLMDTTSRSGAQQHARCEEEGVLHDDEVTSIQVEWIPDERNEAFPD